jgi:WD40 repeat protein
VAGTVKLWAIPSGQEIGRLDGHSMIVSSFDFTPDCTRLVTGSADGTIAVWRLEDLQQLASLVTNEQVRSLNFLPDGRYNQMLCTG